MIPPAVLLEAYRQGVFPMAVDSEIRWFAPDPRAILPLDGFHVPKTLRRALRAKAWEVRMDSAFPKVVSACADRQDTWIDDTIYQSYVALWHAGFAHSVEVYLDGSLAGGLYGVRIGAAFFGESMFHRATDASKIALWALADSLSESGFSLLDTQFNTPHLARFGVMEIPRRHYLKLLRDALGRECSLRLASSWSKDIASSD